MKDDNNKETIITEEELKSMETEVQGLATVSKDVKESVVSIDRNQVRFLVDSYYQAQDFRKAIDNQIRSLEQGFDKSADAEGNKQTAIGWLAANKRNEERQLKNLLSYYAQNNNVGCWMMDTVGIGPVLAAGCIAYFDIDKVTHFNQFWSYAGLNDNNTPWLGKVKAESWVNQWLKDHPEEKATRLTDAIVIDACAAHNRTYESSIHQAYDKKKLDKGQEVITKDSVIAWLARPPYNRNLKVLCWKIGESFLKVYNKKESLYGRLLKSRLVYEKRKNANGDYAEEAKKALESKNWKDKATKKIYESGKLPDGHILARCKRATVKIFIAHLFEAMYYDKYHTDPPCPYAIKYLGHVDYIAPENDYRKYCD